MPFRDIIGHDHLIGLLTRAVARETLPPSLIFAGPRGVGKATTAVALAQLVNCERVVHAARGESAGPGPSIDACGVCVTCQRLARAAAGFQSGDRQAIDCLQWLSPDDKDSIKIEPVREILNRAGYRPLDGRRRLVVIDDAHALEVPAQHALLKTLEEPPPATALVLVTPQAGALLATIRSRCPQLRFGPLPQSDLVRALVQRHGWTAADARTAAALADGRLGRALTLDDPRATADRDIASEVLEQVVDSRGPAERLEAAQVLVARGDAAPAKGEAGRSKTATATRLQLSARLDAMAALLRDIGVLTTRADRGRLANADLMARLDRVAPAFGGDRLTRAFTVVDEAQAALERNASQKVVADWLVLNL
jgi:DNA polymerase-3 subunit delta'